MVAVRKNLDLVWVWFYKEVAPMALFKSAVSGEINLSVSNIAGKVAYAQFHYVGNLGKSFQVNSLFSAFNLADIISSQVGFLGKFFLA